jgi:hypothetical protein
MVVIQDATEPFSAVDGTLDAGPVDRLLDQFIIEPLMDGMEVGEQDDHGHRRLRRLPDFLDRKAVR